MAYDGSLKFDTSLDASGLQKGANNLKSIVEGLGIFEFLKQGVQMVADSVQAAMSRLDTMDQFNRVMTTLTGSTDEANAALERTNEIVAGTAFGLDTASKGVQAFVASGMEVSKATDTMGAWADAVAFYTKGTNAELETVSSALQKMATKGNVTMEHLQMLLEAGVPAIQIYASAVGKSTEEVTEQMSKGELKTDDFISAMNAAFETGTAGFPSIAGAAKDAGASWSGSIDNMNAAITRGVASILTAFDDMFDVKAGMVSFGKGIEKVLKGIADNMDKVVVAAAAVVSGFIAFKVIKTVQASMNAINTSITVANTALLGYSKGMFTAGEAAGVMTLRQAMAGTATMVLSGQMSVGAAVTLVFKKAVQALNAAFLANPIILVISLIAALIAVIVQAVTRTNEAAKAARAEADALVAKQEELTQSAAQSAAEYEKNTAAIKTNAEEAYSMINRLEELRNMTDRTAGEQQEMRDITTQLTTNYSGLSAMIDENTGELTGNAEAWKAVVDAQAQYDTALLALNRAKELTQEATEAQIALEAALTKVDQNQDKIRNNQDRINEANAEAADIYTKLNSGMDMTADEASYLQGRYKELIDESENLRMENDELKGANKTLEEGMGDLSEEAKRLAREEEVQAEYAKAKAEVVMAGYKQQIQAIDEYSAISGEMTDEEIAQIQALIDAGAELPDAELEKFNRIKVGREDYIQAIKDGNVEITEAEAAAIEQRRVNGEELTEIEQAKLDRWNEIAEEYKQSVADTTDDIINSWERLPDEYDLTLDEMIEIGEENAERYGEWSRKMAYLSQYMSEESIAALKELGPGAMGVIDELIVGGSEKMTEFDNMMLGKVQGTAENAASGLGAITPAVVETFNQLNIGVGLKMDEMGNILDTKTNETIASASQILNGDELPQAASDALTKTAAAIRDNQETIAASGEKGQASGNQFSTEYGAAVSSNEAPVTGAQAVAAEVTGALSNADYSGITTGIANAIRSGTGTVSAAVSDMNSSVQKGLQDMTQKSVLEGANLVTKLAARLRFGKTDIVLAITTVVNGVTQKLHTLIASGENVIDQMFAGMRSAVDSAAPSLYRKIDSVCSEIKRRMQNAMQIHSPSRFTEYLFKMLLKGGEVGLDDEKDKLFRKTDQVSAGVLSRIGAIPDGLADKLSAMIAGNQMTVAAAMGGAMAGGNDVNVSVSMPITVNGKMTDSEIQAATDKMVYAVRKKIGRLI